MKNRERLAWAEVVRISGWEKPKPQRRPGAPSNTCVGLWRLGYRTIGEVCAASGLSDSTLITWEGKYLPRMQRVRGMRVVPQDDFDAYVARCVAVRVERFGSQRVLSPPGTCLVHDVMR